jgi:thymidine kinase
MAELVFFSGTMDCGKSTLALQTDHNHSSRGRAGLVFTQMDRAGSSVLSSRLGLRVDAIEVEPGLDLRRVVVDHLSSGGRLDYLICDEAQFYTAEQIEQLADVVDEFGIDVYAFGITTDFRTRLFPGSARLIELADRVEVLQVAALCWCGRRGTHQARTVDGTIVRDGDQVVVGDVDGGGVDQVAYEVLCRDHHRRGLTAAQAEREHLSRDPLPFGE